MPINCFRRVHKTAKVFLWGFKLKSTSCWVECAAILLVQLVSNSFSRLSSSWVSREYIQFTRCPEGYWDFCVRWSKLRFQHWYFGLNFYLDRFHVLFILGWTLTLVVFMFFLFSHLYIRVWVLLILTIIHFCL